MDSHLLHNPYYRAMLSQAGGELPVFKGMPRYQRGDGFGDFFKSIFGRFIIPIATKAGEKFIGQAAQSLQEGKTLKDSLKSGLMPAISTAASTALDTFTKRGAGRRRKRVSLKKKRIYKKRRISQKRTQNKSKKKRSNKTKGSSHKYNF